MRYAHVCTSCSCAMPLLAKEADVEQFMRKAEAQLAKGRTEPQRTTVGKYVDSKAPAVKRALAKVLSKQAKRIATHAALMYHQMLQKDTGAAARIQAIIDQLNFEQLGQDLQGELEGPMLAAFKRAAAVGATQVGFSIADITSQVDDAAVAFADKRGGELIKDLAGTTEDDMRALLSRAVDEGMSADELSSAIEDLGAFSDYRADMIARTELAFAHVQGNLEGWKASGQVEGKRVVLGDAHDVADECDEAADMGVVGVDDDFGGLGNPPFHPHCCVSGTVVTPGGRIAAQFSRLFAGEVVCIRTARNDLTVTPNHPVLTTRGWVAAGALQIGDFVLEAIDPRSVSAAIEPHDHNVPAPIEQVARALLEAGGVASRGMPTTAEAFHGDGSIDGEVDVVWAAGALAMDNAEGRIQNRVHGLLGFGHGGREVFAMKRDRHPLRVRGAAPTNSIVRGASDATPLLRGAACIYDAQALATVADVQTEAAEEVAQGGAVAADLTCEIDARFTGHVPSVESGDVLVAESALQLVDIAATAQRHSSLLQKTLDHLVRNAELTCQEADRLSGLVAVAQIRELVRGQYEGSVHNLMTSHGWYVANGIVVHNCMCDVVPELIDDGSDE